MSPSITLNEYQVQAAKTAIFPKEHALVYTALGLVSEAGELAGAYRDTKLSAFGEKDWTHYTSEMSDLLWYAAAIADVIKLPLQDIADQAVFNPDHHNAYSRGMTVIGINYDAGEIAGAVKKYIRDANGTEFHGSKYEQKIIEHLGSILMHIEVASLGKQTSIANLMQANLDKLRSRQERGVLGGSGDNR